MQKQNIILNDIIVFFLLDVFINSAKIEYQRGEEGIWFRHKYFYFSAAQILAFCFAQPVKF